MAERLFLVDGSAFVFRAFHAIRALSDSHGHPTNAVFGFAKTLSKILREEKPSHIAMVFDAPGKSFRADIFPEYKATRAPTPEDLIAQMPLIDEFVRALNMPLVRVAGVEADDVIGTLARQAERCGKQVVIVTGDKDLLQLVTSDVQVYDPGKGDKGAWYGIEEVRERFGVPPEHVVDALGLMGDAADNVPGVRGIGPKTARSLLEQFGGTIEDVYAHLDELKGKQRENLEKGREDALLSRRLVTIDTEVKLDISVEDCLRKAPDRDRLIDFLNRVEFHSMLDEFLPETEKGEERDYRLVLSEEKLAAAIEEMGKAGEFAIDTETTSVDPMRAELVGISMSCRAGTGYYIPVGHKAPVQELLTGSEEADPGVPATAQLPREMVLERLRPLLEDEAVGKVGHNIKYDLLVFARAGVRLAGISLDTMVASYLTDPSRMRHNLDEVSLHYLKRKLIPISDLIGKGSKAITFDEVPIDRACAYASEDADMAWRLAEALRPLMEERGLSALFDEVERPLIGVLARMEQAGVAIDRTLFDELRREVEGRLAALEEEIVEAAGEPFQVNSPKQLQRILFDKLGLKPMRRTKTGFSTDVEVLEQLAREHPLPEKVLAYRTLEKLRGTYIEALPKLIHPETGRIHTSYNQAVAATGRLSSSDPNLQNIPVRTEMGRRIRRDLFRVDRTGS